MKKQKQLKMKQKKQKKQHIFFWNVKAQVEKLGYEVSTGSLVLTLLLSMFGFFLFGLIMKLTPIWSTPLLVISLYFTPIVYYNLYRNRFQMRRFSDVNVYIEQMLYAFKNSKKILNSLEDVRILFPSGEMRDLMNEACDIISIPSMENMDEDVELKALKLIEDHYNNEHIRSMHRFLLSVQRIGGEFDLPLALLLKSRDSWHSRTVKLQEQRKLKRGEILGSCIAASLICISLLYILPPDVTIATLLPVRIAHIAMVFFMGKIYLKAVRKLSSDLLLQREAKSAEKLRTDYFSFINYNPRKEFKKSILYTLIPLALAILNFFVIKVNVVYMVAAILAIITLCQHMLGHSLLGKRLNREISLAFPQWLLELTLLLQSDNVQVSIFKTVGTALPIMQPELEKLKASLLETPSSPEPFLHFFIDFNLPEITTSMQMLYALSIGSGGDSKEQIANIVERNNNSLDRAETKLNDDSIAGLYALFLSPMLVSSAVLMLDMSLFLVNYITKLTL